MKAEPTIRMCLAKKYPNKAPIVIHASIVIQYTTTGLAEMNLRTTWYSIMPARKPRKPPKDIGGNHSIFEMNQPARTPRLTETIINNQNSRVEY